jgi:hypothetical protein
MIHLLLVSNLVLVLLGFGAASASVSNILLQSTNIDVRQEMPEIPLSNSSYPALFLVHLKQHNSHIKNYIQRLSRAQLFDYLPYNTYYLFGNAHTAEQIKKMPMVDWVSVVKPSWRIEQSLAKQFKPENKSWVSESGEKIKILTEAIVSLVPSEVRTPNFRIDTVLDSLSKELRLRGLNAKVHLETVNVVRLIASNEEELSRSVNVVSRYPPVMFIERALQFLPRLKWAKPFVLDGLQSTSEINSAYSENSLLTDTLGLTGDGEIIGFADTGIQRGNCFLTSPGAPSYTPQAFSGSYLSNVLNISNHPTVVQYYSYPTSHSDDLALHGTFLAGIMVGKPPSSFPSQEKEAYYGIARFAKLAVMDLQQSNNLQVPPDIGAMLDVAYQVGARTYCSAFSGIDPALLTGGYSDTARYSSHTNSLDNYTYFKQDLLVVVPAGFTECLSGTSSVGSLGWSKVRFRTYFLDL